MSLPNINININTDPIASFGNDVLHGLSNSLKFLEPKVATSGGEKKSRKSCWFVLKHFYDLELWVHAHHKLPAFLV